MSALIAVSGVGPATPAGSRWWAFDSMESEHAASADDVQLVVGYVDDRASPSASVQRERAVSAPPACRGSSADIGEDGLRERVPRGLPRLHHEPLDYSTRTRNCDLDAVKRLRFYTSALLDGSITPAAVAEDWGTGSTSRPSWRRAPEALKDGPL